MVLIVGLFGGFWVFGCLGCLLLRLVAVFADCLGFVGLYNIGFLCALEVG